jgi:hypothetical protein
MTSRMVGVATRADVLGARRGIREHGGRCWSCVRVRGAVLWALVEQERRARAKDGVEKSTNARAICAALRPCGPAASMRPSKMGHRASSASASAQPPASQKTRIPNMPTSTRPRPELLLLLLLTSAAAVWANTEKTIFVGPSSIALPNVKPGLDDLCLNTLSPESPVLQTQLSVAFPSAESDQGVQSWYLLDRLSTGQRYELRICWPATVRLITRLSSRLHSLQSPRVVT